VLADAGAEALITCGIIVSCCNLPQVKTPYTLLLTWLLFLLADVDAEAFTTCGKVISCCSLLHKKMSS
jgi:hypothetical protein